MTRCQHREPSTGSRRTGSHREGARCDAEATRFGDFCDRHVPLFVTANRYHGPGWCVTLYTGVDDDDGRHLSHDFRLWGPWQRPADSKAMLNGEPAGDRIGWSAGWHDETGARGVHVSKRPTSSDALDDMLDDYARQVHTSTTLVQRVRVALLEQARRHEREAVQS